MQKLQLLWQKAQPLQIVQSRFQAGKNRIAALKRVGAEKQVENRLFFRHPLLQVTGQHGQFVQIRQQWRIAHECSRGT